MEDNVMDVDDTESMGSGGSTESLEKFLSDFLPPLSPCIFDDLDESIQEVIGLGLTQPSNSNKFEASGERVNVDDTESDDVQELAVNHIPVPNLGTSSDFVATEGNNKIQMDLNWEQMGKSFEKMNLDTFPDSPTAPYTMRQQQKGGRTAVKNGSKNSSKISSIHRREKENAEKEKKRKNDSKNSREYTRKIKEEKEELSDYLNIFRQGWNQNNGSWTDNSFGTIQENVMKKSKEQKDHKAEWNLGDVINHRIQKIFEKIKECAPMPSIMIENLAKERDKAREEFKPFESIKSPPGMNKNTYGSGRCRHKSRKELKERRHDLAEILFKFRQFFNKEMLASSSY